MRIKFKWSHSIAIALTVVAGLGVYNYQKFKNFESEVPKNLKTQVLSDITPLSCNDDYYLLQPDGDESEIFHFNLKGELSTFGEDEFKLAEPTLAYNPIDNYLYSVTIEEELVRIGKEGKSESVGKIRNLSDEPTAATFMADGTLVVLHADMIIGFFNISDIGGKKELIREIEIKGVQIQSLARNPENGLLYSFDDKSKQIVEINPYTGDYRFIGERERDIREINSAVFTKNGNLYMHGKTAKGNGALFAVDISSGKFDFISGDTNSISSNDGTSCVEGVDPQEPISTINPLQCNPEDENQVIYTSFAFASGKASRIYKFNDNTNPKFQVSEIEEIRGDIVALGHDPIYEYVYAITIPSPKEPDVLALVRIGDNEESETVKTFTLGTTPTGGTFMADGRFLVHDEDTLFFIDTITGDLLDTIQIDATNVENNGLTYPELSDTALPFGVTDLSRDPKTGYLYGIDQRRLNLVQINPLTGEALYIGNKSAESEDKKTFLTAFTFGTAFQTDGNFYIFASPDDDGRPDRLLVIKGITTGQMEFVTTNKTQATDMATCMKGIDLGETPEPTDPEETGTPGSVPTVPTVTVCQPREADFPEFGEQCVRAFPAADPFNKEKQSAYENYQKCKTARNKTEFCMKQWVNELELKECSSNQQCESGTEIIVSPTEIKHEEGCFEFKGDVYCPHTYENECVTIEDFDGREATYCQPRNQENVVLKTCIERFYTAVSPTTQSRNGVSCAFRKYGKYEKPEQGNFVGTLQYTDNYYPLKLAQGICVNDPNPTFGPFIVQGEYPCKPVLIDKYTSKNYDKYGTCILEGGRRDDCVAKWLIRGMSAPRFCEVASDCK